MELDSPLRNVEGQWAGLKPPHPLPMPCSASVGLSASRCSELCLGLRRQMVVIEPVPVNEAPGLTLSTTGPSRPQTLPGVAMADPGRSISPQHLAMHGHKWPPDPGHCWGRGRESGEAEAVIGRTDQQRDRQEAGPGLWDLTLRPHRRSAICRPSFRVPSPWHRSPDPLAAPSVGYIYVLLFLAYSFLCANRCQFARVRADTTPCRW